MTAHRLITAALVGVVAALAVSAVRAKHVLDVTQAQGVTANVAGVDVHIRPPAGGSGKTVTLPPEAQQALDSLPAVAIGSAVIVAVVAFIVTRP